MMELFRHKVFKMLLAQEKITETHVEKLLAWRHTGFSVYGGEQVDAEDKKGREHLVSYYGWYSNRQRGERKKAGQRTTDDVPSAPSEAESDFKKEARRHWARLIKRVYEVDPLVCPQCSGRMHIISFIEDTAVIERILRHLGLWHVPARQRAPPPTPSEITLDYSVADEPASYD